MEMETKPEAPAENETLAEAVELGKWLGRREAFGLVAGRCAAADIESLRRIRAAKLHRKFNCTWAQYCTQYLRVNRRSVDRAIGYLEEFGPPYFHLAQMTHIGPKEYRYIASHVSEGGVQLDGALITFQPENNDRISAAVAKLLKEIEREPKDAPAVSFDAALRRCKAIVETLRALPPGLDQLSKMELAEALAEIRNAASDMGFLPDPI